MPFGLHRHKEDASTFEWFRSLAEVPGVEWTPVEVAVDEHLAGARPVPADDAGRYPGLPTHRWVDRTGQEIGGEYSFHNSPAAVITERLYELPPERQLELSLTALAHPGTRHDYAQVLGGASRLIQHQGVERFDLVEPLLRAHTSVILADPELALNEPWETHKTALEHATWPFVALMSLYQLEGFLRDAHYVEQLLDRFPESAKPSYMQKPWPSELIGALRELR